MKKIRSLISKKLVLVIILIISLAGVGGGVLFYNNYQKQKNPADSAAVEIGSLTRNVSKLIDLPASEIPQLATVSDITKLKDEPFFAKAQNGDKVLIFTKAKKAIIYRPSTNRIIEVAFYTPPAVQASPSASATPARKIVRVAIYNGTTIVGYTKTIQARLEGKFSNIEIVARENASKSDYKKTIVVDLSGGNKSLAQSISAELKGEVGSLPEGEAKPDSDILVILGQAK